MTGHQRFAVGDRVYRYVWVGGERHDLQPLTVVKVTPSGYRVVTDRGSRMWLRTADIVDHYPGGPS